MQSLHLKEECYRNCTLFREKKSQQGDLSPRPPDYESVSTDANIIVAYNAGKFYLLNLL